jgi:hypothetical protein
MTGDPDKRIVFSKKGWQAMRKSETEQAAPRGVEQGQITFAVQPLENGRFACTLAPGLTDQVGAARVFYGESREHALAVAFEHLADHYRTAAEAGQLAREPRGAETTGGPLKRYHVILHYEDTVEEESRFEALHSTLLGNTVIENAKCTLIEIAPDALQQVLQRSWELDDESARGD